MMWWLQVGGKSCRRDGNGREFDILNCFFYFCSKRLTLESLILFSERAFWTKESRNSVNSSSAWAERKTKATSCVSRTSKVAIVKNSEHSIGLSSNSAPTIMRVPFKGLAACAAAFFLVIASVDCVNAENEQHLYYKEYERLQKQVKPVNYNLQDLSNNQHSTNRRIPNYQHPQFSNPNFPSRTYGVQQQEQRQEHPIHEPNQRVLQIENTKYSVWSQNMSYKSSVGYNPLGMGQLYNLTNQAIDLFVDKKEPIPNGE